MSNNMTPNIDKILQSLQKNTEHLDNLNEQIYDLSESSQDLFNTIKLNKEYNDELNNLNNLSSYNTRASLINSLENERKTIESLENENNELQSTIENHQNVLEIIMKKYNDHKLLLENLNQLEQSYQLNNNNDILCDRYKFYQTKLNELIPLINLIDQIDHNEIEKQQNLIDKFIQENNKIKLLLQQQLHDNDDDE